MEIIEGKTGFLLLTKMNGQRGVNYDLKLVKSLCSSQGSLTKAELEVFVYYVEMCL